MLDMFCGLLLLGAGGGGGAGAVGGDARFDGKSFSQGCDIWPSCFFLCFVRFLC